MQQMLLSLLVGLVLWVASLQPLLNREYDMAENIADKYDATGKSSGLMAKVDKTKKADKVEGQPWYANFVGMWYNSDDTSGEEASSVAAIQMEPHESMLARIQTSRKPAYDPEDDNLVGRFDGQLGFASTNTNDTSSAVADAIIGNSVANAPVVVPTLTPAEQTKVDKALRAGLMARATKQGSMLDGADKIDRDFFAMRPEGSNAKRIENTPLLTSSFEDIATAENPDTGAMVHLDSENIITLWNGVVPTGGLTYRGRSIPAEGHGLTPPQLSEVDYSNAVSQGINRSDYEDGKDGYDQWSKAVFTVYADKVAEQAGLQNDYGTNALVNNNIAFDDLPDGAKKMMYDIGWNGGEGSAKWSGVSKSAYEASKPIEDQTTDNLIDITKHFSTNDGARWRRGVLKRRAMQYNNVAKPGEIATNINTTPWNDAKGNRKGTTYAIQTANGTTLKTYNKPDLNEDLGDLEVPQGG
jgi:hypothetical protein